MIHPLVLGVGRRLFGGDARSSLRLVDNSTTSTGVLIATYETARGLGRRMRRSAAVGIAVAWGVGVGGTFGCLLLWLLGYWRVQHPLPYWAIAEAGGVVLICLGLVPIVQALVVVVRAGGTPVPAASSLRLVVSGFYRYVRNPIYLGFLVVLIGQALVFGSMGLVVYAAVAWRVGAAAVRFYEQPRLVRRFGAEYRQYLQAVPAWIPRLHPWTPESVPGHRLDADDR